MKSFRWDYKKAGDDSYRVSWFMEDLGKAPETEICSKTVKVSGEVQDIEVSLSFVATELQREHYKLFEIEPEPMNMDMEDMSNVHN